MLFGRVINCCCVNAVDGIGVGYMNVDDEVLFREAQNKRSEANSAIIPLDKHEALITEHWCDALLGADCSCLGWSFRDCGCVQRGREDVV